MKALKFVATVVAVGVFAGVGFGWAAIHYPVIVVALCIAVIIWDLRRYAEKHADSDGLVPHSFGESFDNAAQAMHYDIDEDELPYKPVEPKPVWPNHIGGVE